MCPKIRVGPTYYTNPIWNKQRQVPRVLLEKQATTGPLSKNLVCQLSSKRWVTHYPRVTKKKTNMANNLNRQPNKQGTLTSLKGYISVVSISGFCLELLWVAFASYSTCLCLNLLYSWWQMFLSQSFLHYGYPSVHVQF